MLWDHTTIGHTRPFLKWVGGKRQLLPRIRQFYPAVFGEYIEPFVGSGAVFFDLHNRGLLNGRRATLFDDNADLVGCYLNVRDHTNKVVRNLSRLSLAHQKSPAEHYYRIRDERFNPGRRRIFRGNSPDSAGYTPSLAAMLIYLNRTGYNGLFSCQLARAVQRPSRTVQEPEDLRRREPPSGCRRALW